MKTRDFLILLVLLIGMTNCEKEGQNIEGPVMEDLLDTLTGINFVTGSQQNPYVIVKYDEITGYDSTIYTFCLNESAWKRLEDKILPIYPDPHFGFSVFLNNELIYRASFIPPYYSMSYFNIITFMIKESDLVYMELGYAAPPESFRGEDLRNDQRLIEQLKKDNKLIQLEN